MKKNAVKRLKVADIKKTRRQNKSKKHPCPDCSFCQLCNDEKCAMCRPKKHSRSMSKRKVHQPLFCRF